MANSTCDVKYYQICVFKYYFSNFIEFTNFHMKNDI